MRRTIGEWIWTRLSTLEAKQRTKYYWQCVQRAVPINGESLGALIHTGFPRRCSVLYRSARLSPTFHFVALGGKGKEGREDEGVVFLQMNAHLACPSRVCSSDGQIKKYSWCPSLMASVRALCSKARPVTHKVFVTTRSPSLSLDRTETCSSDGNVNISSSPLGFYRFLSCWTLWIYAIICLWDDKKQNRERYLKLRDYTGRGKKPKASFAIVWIPIGHQSRSPLLAWWRRRSTGD